MQLGCEVSEIIRTPKVRVQTVQILLPVAMVRLAIAGIFWQVLNDGRDPNLPGSESEHNVIEGVQQDRLTAEKPMPWM